MSATITVPSRVAYRARVGLARAEQVVDSLSELFDLVASLFAHRPPAQDDEALTIRRAWLRASA
jgi:hypothetical protein